MGEQEGSQEHSHLGKMFPQFLEISLPMYEGNKMPPFLFSLGLRQIIDNQLYLLDF